MTDAPRSATPEPTDEALDLVEQILLMTDERDDSVPLTDWLPDEWVERASELVNARPVPPSEPPRPAEPLDAELLTEAFLTVFPGWIDEADGDRSEIEENAEAVAAEYARLTPEPSTRTPGEDQ